MNQMEFDVQVNRLRDVFGDRAYSGERTKLLWREVGQFSGIWFARVVDSFIGSFRQPPLLSDFREVIAKERELQYQIQRAAESQDAEDFWSGTYHPEDIKTIVRFIKKRAFEKSVSDEDWNNFLKQLNSIGKGSPRRLNECSKCGNVGLHLVRENGGDVAYRCRCAVGEQKNPQIPPIPREREHEILS